MNTKDMIANEQDWHLRYLHRNFEIMREREAKGERDITVSIDWIKAILARDIGLHQRLIYLEQRLIDFAQMAFPPLQKVPSMPHPGDAEITVQDIAET